MTPSFVNAPAYVFHWNVFSIDIYISAANLFVICLMILVFALALLLPHPRGATSR
jgi:type IV secretory pathway component VirB8